tara:strand:+ start:3359 stop:3817 length:459 start_codon:yes stop_codon:yes gene_type:complete
MNKKTIFIILLFFLLQHCGYSPIYTNVKNLDFNLNVKNISGNNDINNLIKIYIQQYSNKSGNKNLDLNIKTEYVKSVLSKNKEGKITNFLIKSKIEFELISLEENKNYIFQEETRAASMDDQFEFKKYENTIKRNFVNSAIEQLILKITTTQ